MDEWQDHSETNNEEDYLCSIGNRSFLHLDIYWVPIDVRIIKNKKLKRNWLDYNKTELVSKRSVKTDPPSKLGNSFENHVKLLEFE